MKVTLLGTAAAEGWPGLFCRCEACDAARKLGGKDIRTRSSALIDNVLKIDFPPDTLHQVLRNNLDLRRLTALLFTHAHDDHCCPSELQYRGPYFVPEPFSDPLPVYGPEDAIRKIETHLGKSATFLALHPLQPWQTVVIGSYRVTPILAQHDPAYLCFNYILQDAAGATLLYATDTGWYEEPTWRFLETFVLDGMVAECTKGLEEGGYMAHMCIAEVVRMRQKLVDSGQFRPDGPLVTTHFSHLCGLLHADLEVLLTPHGIQAGYDGMTFQVRPASSRSPAAPAHAEAVRA